MWLAIDIIIYYVFMVAYISFLMSNIILFWGEKTDNMPFREIFFSYFDLLEFNWVIISVAAIIVSITFILIALGVREEQIKDKEKKDKRSQSCQLSEK